VISQFENESFGSRYSKIGVVKYLKQDASMERGRSLSPETTEYHGPYDQGTTKPPTNRLTITYRYISLHAPTNGKQTHNAKTKTKK
jgi:hypothetical protein